MNGRIRRFLRDLYLDFIVVIFLKFVDHIPEVDLIVWIQVVGTGRIRLLLKSFLGRLEQILVAVAVRA